VHRLAAGPPEAGPAPMISFGGTAGPSSSGGKNFGVELPSLDWQGLKRTCERLKSCLQGRGDVPAPGGPPPRPDYLSKKRLQMEEFIEALRHEIFYQYNAARADPQGYADTTPGARSPQSSGGSSQGWGESSASPSCHRRLAAGGRRTAESEASGAALCCHLWRADRRGDEEGLRRRIEKKSRLGGS